MMILLVLVFMSAVFAVEPCLTMEHLPNTSFRNAFPPPPPSGEKDHLDAYSLPNMSFSENFALRWGDARPLSEEYAQSLLAEFERSWEHEIDEMGFPEPLGSDSHLFNVYIGNSGSGAPSSYGAAGYYSSDSAGWPMIVIDLPALEQMDSYGVIPHEFFHAVQHACDTYSYEGESAWYWEATAIWIENEVYPEDPAYALYLFGFAFFPHKSLYYFNYPDTGSLDEYYQYGAFIFPKFLSTVHADSMDVRDSWMLSSYDETPLSWWEDFFSTRTFEDIVFEFALRNSYWDYEHGEWYQYYLDYYREGYSNEDVSITQKVHAYGEADWQSIPDALLPENLGVNYIRLENPLFSTLEVGLIGDEIGDQGTTASWKAGLIRKLDMDISYIELDMQQTQVIENLSEDEELTLVVMPIAADAGWGEQFSYEYLLVDYQQSSTEPTSDPEDSPKLGCTTLKEGKGWMWVLIGLCALRTRKNALYKKHCV